ncbi:BglG family transcription antiterminator LicT [Turicibacter bilis]|uniref:PRD domain-containing protein n=1 Tax=Turicibacter bilis TaxID=2735723 RepID=A0ABY5JG97_9FIRM|nr:PRD domain-containing protein [Turicibacter bilis]MBS3201354.1 PRD domain-containing protein [Turicibacter bilis]UUF05716.1 PRD domain-containing protein [Turicibacter bilis]
MYIEKVLNNNAFISLDENGDEIIVMGKGIAFGKKGNQKVDLTNLNYKIFSCKNKNINNKLISIVSDLSQEYILLTRKIILTFEKEYNKKLNEIIYVSLTEHIHGAIERYHQGIQVKNPLLMEIKRLFADEYEIGRRALEMIHQDFGVLFEEDEAGYIAYHIVNAELNNDMINIANITKVMQQVLSVIKYHFKVEFNEESSTYYRFITHLKFFAQRVFSNAVYEEEDTELFFILKEKYHESYECVLKIKELIEHEYNYDLSLEEQLYLMIHIERIRTKATI